MTTIYKYHLEFFRGTGTECVRVQMPRDAIVLALQMQHDVPCIWARVDSRAEPQTRTFLLYGTGHIIHDAVPHEYRGTFQIGSGSLVFHVFEVPTEQWNP